MLRGRLRGPLGALRARATCRLRRAAPARATCRLRRAVPAPAARPVGGTVRVRACCRRSGPSSAPLRTLLTLAPRASGRLWRTRARFEGRLSSPGHLGGFSVLPAYIWRVPGEPQLPHGLQLQAERGAVCVTSRRSRASCLRLPPTAVCRASASARLEGRRGGRRRSSMAGPSPPQGGAVAETWRQVRYGRGAPSGHVLGPDVGTCGPRRTQERPCTMRGACAQLPAREAGPCANVQTEETKKERCSEVSLAAYDLF